MNTRATAVAGRRGMPAAAGEGGNALLPRAASPLPGADLRLGGYQPVGWVIHVQNMRSVGQPIHKS